MPEASDADERTVSDLEPDIPTFAASLAPVVVSFGKVEFALMFEGDRGSGGDSAILNFDRVIKVFASFISQLYSL